MSNIIKIFGKSTFYLNNLDLHPKNMDKFKYLSIFCALFLTIWKKFIFILKKPGR